MSADLKYTQNFLHSPALVRQIVALGGVQTGETVLEIGAGKGIITRELARAVGTEGRVMAVELDPVLVSHLNAELRDTPQVSVISQDIRTFDFATIPAPYGVFSNVPFSITSELLERLFSPPSNPHRAALILQTDTLISASAYGDGETLKSLWLKPYYRVKVLHRFSPSDFTPRPGVDTALFGFERLPAPMIAPEHEALYRDFLAFVSKDRVGEGAWKKVFTPAQLATLTAHGGLIAARGIKSQTVEGVVAAFRAFVASPPAKRAQVRGALASLRDTQKRTEQINQQGGHHRSRQTPPATPRKKPHRR